MEIFTSTEIIVYNVLPPLTKFKKAITMNNDKYPNCYLVKAELNHL